MKNRGVRAVFRAPLKLFWVVLLLCNWGYSQKEAPIKVVSLSAQYNKARSMLKLDCELSIPHPWHINSDTLEQAYLVPTRLVVAEDKGAEVKRDFPKPTTMELLGEKVDVFADELKFSQMFFLSGTFPIKGKLQYQACSDKICMPPKYLDFSLTADDKNNVRAQFTGEL